MSGTATVLGTGPVSASVPGLSAAFSAVGSSLLALSASVRAQSDAIGRAAASIDAQVDALGLAQSGISAVALASVQAQIDASAAASLSLKASLPDPAGYFLGLLEGLKSVQASLAADVALPAVSLGASIAASGTVSLGLEAEKAEIVAQISVLSSISLSLASVAVSVMAVQQALSAALSAAAAALATFSSMTATLAVGPAWAIVYDGTLGSMGAALDLAVPSTGLPGSTVVRTTLQLVSAADSPAFSAQAAVLRTS